MAGGRRTGRDRVSGDPRGRGRPGAAPWPRRLALTLGLVGTLGAGDAWAERAGVWRFRFAQPSFVAEGVSAPEGHREPRRRLVSFALPAPVSTEPSPGRVHARLAERRRHPLEWESEETALVWSFVGLALLDAYQTTHQPPGFREANPLLASWAGDRPDGLEVFAFKLAVTYGIIRLIDRSPTQGSLRRGSITATEDRRRRRRKRLLWIVNALQLGVVLHNERVTGGILFD